MTQSNSEHLKAIIVGASSGIGRELAFLLAQENYDLGLMARRYKPLLALQQELHTQVHVKATDIRNIDEVQAGMRELITSLGGLDLVVISAGIGPMNMELELHKELDTIATNVLGFSTVANLAMHYFLRQGYGHLVGISSIAGIRGNAAAPAYNASKAYVANYLQGLAQKSVRSGSAITITDIQPGFVATAMAKGEGQFWVAPVRKAAEQIVHAIKRKQRHRYVTRRWRLIAWLLRSMPAYVYNRI